MKKLINLLSMNNISNVIARRENVTNHGFANTWIRCNFRLFLDGSYTGEHDYRYNYSYLNEIKEKPRSLRAFVVGRFIQFLVHTHPELTEYKIRKAIKIAFDYSKDNKAPLEKFNQELIEDALDLIA